MRAALVREVGALPEVGDAPDPSGETIEVLAAPINPIDLAVSRGICYRASQLPYVPGCEAVGRIDDRIVWIFGGSLGRTRRARWRSALRSATHTRSTCRRAWMRRSPPDSASPASPDGCRSPGARR